MYDIKIFLEDNGQFGAEVIVGDETIYGLGNTQSELLEDLKKGFELSSEYNKSDNAKKIYSFIDYSNKKELCL